MAAQSGSTYISESMTDIIEIPTIYPEFSTTSSSAKVLERQQKPEMTKFAPKGLFPCSYLLMNSTLAGVRVVYTPWHAVALHIHVVYSDCCACHYVCGVGHTEVVSATNGVVEAVQSRSSTTGRHLGVRQRRANDFSQWLHLHLALWSQHPATFTRH